MNKKVKLEGVSLSHVTLNREEFLSFLVKTSGVFLNSLATIMSTQHESLTFSAKVALATVKAYNDNLPLQRLKANDCVDIISEDEIHYASCSGNPFIIQEYYEEGSSVARYIVFYSKETSLSYVLENINKI